MTEKRSTEIRRVCEALFDTYTQVAANDVAKSLNFCQQLSFPVLGLVENMSGFVCPDCGKTHALFASDGGNKLAEKYNLPFVLLSDPDRIAIEAYGVWQEKVRYGKASMGIVRTS